MNSHICLILVQVLAAFAAHAEFKSDDTTEADWWETAVFYQIYPRSFMDSDGDGIGDLQGIIQKLDHLKDAGVTAVWFSPIFKSPQVDQGYDISDFKDIDPDYGTLDDLQELLVEAKEAGIKIILDFVPNHTSDEHEWFKKSVGNESGFEDFYVWHDGKTVDGEKQPPNNWLSEFGGSAWEFNVERQQYYYHAFAPEQPDLNYENPDVVEAMKDVLRYWLDFGADGFRVDAISYLYEDPDWRDEPLYDGCTDATNKDCLDSVYTKDLQGTYDLVYDFREILDNFTETNNVDTRVMMTEAYSSLEKITLYYGDGNRNGAHFPFNFMLFSLSKGFNAYDVYSAVSTWMASASDSNTHNWVLGNHDNHRVATRLGIEYVDSLNMLMSFLPGVMVTYNGEEIGMENGEVSCEQGYDPRAIKDCATFNETSRDFERTPYHWDNTTNAGFTNGTPWLPVSIKAQDVNLAAQNVEGVASHYNVYKQLMELRKTLRKYNKSGATSIGVKNDDAVLQIRRVIDDDEFILLFNTGETEESVEFDHEHTNYKVLVTTDEDAHKIGDVIKNNSMQLVQYEGVILQDIVSRGLTVHHVASYFILIFLAVLRIF